MPDVSTDAPERSAAPVDPAAPAAAWHGVSRGAAPSRRTRQGRQGRRWLRWLRVVALVILLPVAAAGIGLLIAWIVHEVRGNPTAAPAATHPVPSASATKTTPPSPTPAPVVVPADWVAETDPPTGVTYRHPPGWIRRTALPEILRFAPASAGSQTPESKESALESRRPPIRPRRLRST